MEEQQVRDTVYKAGPKRYTTRRHFKVSGYYQRLLNQKKGDKSCRFEVIGDLFSIIRLDGRLSGEPWES